MHTILMWVSMFREGSIVDTEPLGRRRFVRTDENNAVTKVHGGPL